MDKYLYYVNDKPYLNITNKCSNACDFCIRNGRQTMDGQELWLKNPDPTTQQVLQSFPADLNYQQEFVFCGFGEPTENFETFLGVARAIKQKGGKVRLNTNGQSDLINGKPTAKKICEVTDVVSISLNDCNAQDYQKLCHSRYGEQAFDALIDFATQCAKLGREVIMSVVDVIGKEKIEKCQEICAKAGVKLKVRTYITIEQY